MDPSAPRFFKVQRVVEDNILAAVRYMKEEKRATVQTSLDSFSKKAVQPTTSDKGKLNAH